MKDRRASISEAAELVADGARIGFGGSVGLYRRPVAFAHELIRQGRRDLDTFGILNGIEVDTLIGGGCVASTNSSYVGFDELGQAPNFQAAASAGRITVNEWTEWMITASYRAANMAIPYIPWITSRRNDVTEALGLKEVECPYTGRQVLAVRANTLDVAVIQAVKADAEGNTEIPTPLDHMWDADCLVARAAKTIVVCVEEIGEIDPNQVQLIGREVAAVVEAPRGAAPGGLLPAYGIDHAHINDVYVPAAREGRFDEYLERFVFGQEAIA